MTGGDDAGYGNRAREIDARGCGDNFNKTGYACGRWKGAFLHPVEVGVRRSRWVPSRPTIESDPLPKGSNSIVTYAAQNTVIGE